jgi:hypothetical protein
MQRCVEVERKRDAGQKMLKRIAKRSVDSVGKNPIKGTKNLNLNLNLNQQLGEIAKRNVLEGYVEDKRIGDNVLKRLQISAKKPVRERKNQRRKNPQEGGKEGRYFD